MVTQGKTLNEVTANLKEAISLHLEDSDADVRNQLTPTVVRLRYVVETSPTAASPGADEGPRTADPPRQPAGYPVGGAPQTLLVLDVRPPAAMVRRALPGTASIGEQSTTRPGLIGITVKNEKQTDLVVPERVRQETGHQAWGFRAAADVEYTPEQRRVIDARLAKSDEDIKHGRVYGPFNTAEEMAVSIEAPCSMKFRIVGDTYIVADVIPHPK